MAGGVGYSFVWIGVRFEEDAIGACGQGGAGQAGAVPAVPYNPGMYYMQPPPGTMAGGQWPPQMSQDPYQNQMPPKQ